MADKKAKAQDELPETKTEVLQPAVDATMVPASVRLGQIVIYKLSQQDVQHIDANRNKWDSHHRGNTVSIGQCFPMIVTAVWGGQCCNGQVMLDGNDRLWVKSRNYGDQPGQWT